MFRVVEIIFYGILTAGLIISASVGTPYVALLTFFGFAINWSIGSRWYFNHKKACPGHIQRFGPITSGLGLLIVFLAVPLNILRPSSVFEDVVLVGLVLVSIGLLINSIIHRKHLGKTWLFGLKAILLCVPAIWLSFSSLNTSGLNFRFRTLIIKNDNNWALDYKILEHQKLLEDATEKQEYAKAYHHAQKAFVYKHVLELEVLQAINYLNSDMVQHFKPADVLSHVKPTDGVHPSLLRSYEPLLQSALNYGSQLGEEGEHEEAIKVFSSSLAPGYLLLQSHTWSDTIYFKFYSGVMVELVESSMKIGSTRQADSIAQLWDKRQLDYLKENKISKETHQPYCFSKARLHDAFNEKELAILYYKQIIVNGIKNPEKADDLIMGISITQCLTNHLSLSEIQKAAELQQVGNKLLTDNDFVPEAYFFGSSIVYRLLGQYDLAEAQLLKRLERFTPDAHPRKLKCHKALTNLYIDWEKPNKAETYKQLIWLHPLADTFSASNTLLAARLLDLRGKTYAAYQLAKEKEVQFASVPGYQIYLADLANRLYYPHAAFSHLVKHTKGDSSFSQLNTVNECVLAASILVQRNDKFKSQRLLDNALLYLKNYPVKAPMQASYYNCKALWFASIGQPDSATQYFQAAIDRCDPNRTTLQKYQIALNHAQMLINFSQYEEAGEILGDLLYEQKRLPTSKNLLVAQYYYLTSKLFEKMGNDPEGRDHFMKKSMTIYESILPKDHPIFQN